jgi:hypothetical protein
LSSDAVRDDDSEQGKSVHSANSKQYEELSKNQVKRILIVDPNPSILSLFCKSMGTMFPSAELVTAQNADRGLKLIQESLLGQDQVRLGDDTAIPSKFEQQKVSFDIIIIEQRLCPYSPLLRSRDGGLANGNSDVEQSCNQASCSSAGKFQTLAEEQQPTKGSALPWNLSMPDMHQHGVNCEEEQNGNFRCLTKPGSFFQYEKETACREPQCGSDLIRAIVLLEQHVSSTGNSDMSLSKDHHHHSSTESLESPFQWRALLIGVSMQPDRDAKPMQQAGADLIWGKPIPRVGNALRNQLIKALLNKRCGSC